MLLGKRNKCVCYEHMLHMYHMLLPLDFSEPMYSEQPFWSKSRWGKRGHGPQKTPRAEDAAEKQQGGRASKNA